MDTSSPLKLLLHFAHTTATHQKVTCGSTIKLAHAATGTRLHSHEVSYSRGSQQQSVTGFPASDNAGSYWSVVGTQVCARVCACVCVRVLGLRVCVRCAA